jgi:hypothetical protein
MALENEMLNRLIAIFILITVFSQVAHCRKDLLKFLIGRNEAARRKIKTAQYRVKWTADLQVREGRRHNEGVGEVKMKGDWRLSTQECNASIPATGWKQKQTPSMVINDKSPDIFALRFAFDGARRTTFREMMKLHPDKIQWTAEEAKQPSGDTVYLIKRCSPFMHDPAKPDGVWTIDPQRGFLVTQAVFYSRSGNVWITRKTEPKEFGSGIWVPVSYHERRYESPTDPQAGKEPDSRTTIRLEEISINDEISDDYFGIMSIFPEEYRGSTVLFRKGLDGNTEAYLYRNGRFVVRDLSGPDYIHGMLRKVPIPLRGKALPELKDLRIDLSPADADEKVILVCFFDMEQRPSRNCLRQLSERAEELKANDVLVAAIHASKVDENILNEWLKKNNIPFPAGIVTGDEGKIRFIWGVRSLPWLILTDREHIVRAEGFSIGELNEKVKPTEQ